MNNKNISSFIKYQRGVLKMTQEELAERAGVGLRFIRELEQGKESLRMDKVNQVLALFGRTLSAASGKITDPYDILMYHFNRSVHVLLKNKTELFGFIIDDVKDNKTNAIVGWEFVTNNHAIAYRKTAREDLKQIIDHADIERIENID